MLNGQSRTEVIETVASAIRTDAVRRSAGRRPQLVIAADGALFCQGLRALVEAGGHFQVASQTHDGAEALRLATELRPDVLVLDSAVPRFPGTTALRSVVGEPSTTGLVLLAASLVGSTIPLAVDGGARGLVLKSASADVFLAAIRAVADGEGWIDREIASDFAQAAHRRYLLDAAALPLRRLDLTVRERQIVAAVAAASANKDIARQFGISETTVKHHLTSIFGKVGVSSRLELARFAMSSSLIPSGSAPSPGAEELRGTNGRRKAWREPTLHAAGPLPM